MCIRDSRTTAPSRLGAVGNADAGVHEAHRSTLSHPDSHRRPRNFTGSTRSRQLRVRGLSPPVGTFTQPRGLARLCPSGYHRSHRIETRSISPIALASQVRNYPRPATLECGRLVGPTPGEKVECVSHHGEDDLEPFECAGRRARQVNLAGSSSGALEGLEVILPVVAHALDLLAGGRPH